ncbi:unnamed protein product [Parnassius apollo]|uniref:(apollo) hypothetical protein n=1 Tax=Parnassius apollo TaxID=110799 RepID=A0A8S3W4S6_PARAO|nr:unnamed protein product [Parnassius apollo]
MGYLASKEVIDKECQDTANVILFFNLFDSLNGSYLRGWIENVGGVAVAEPYVVVWDVRCLRGRSNAEGA